VRIILLSVGLLVIASTISACSSTITGYNPTVFPFRYAQEAVNETKIKRVILAPVSIGAPVRSHLRKAERKTKAVIKAYLRSNGYEILPNYQFDNAWKQANRTYGNVFDPSTGKVNADAWRATMVTVAEKLRAETQADAIIFADIIVHETTHSIGQNHYAKWYGVTRKPSIKGAGNGIPMDFDWSQPVRAASLQVTVFGVDKLQQLFSSIGGVDTLQTLNLKGSDAGYTRRKKLLSNDKNLEEGIKIAFHPFIPMANYPGDKEQ
jgi:hypothetical protein